MYSTKEKICLSNKLSSRSAAEKDLTLLAVRVPSSPDIGRYSRNPSRYAEEILYALLDVATAEEIVANRRKKEMILPAQQQKQQPKKQQPKKQQPKKQQPKKQQPKKQQPKKQQPKKQQPSTKAEEPVLNSAPAEGTSDPKKNDQS